jgi:hypothetical protein
VNQKKNYADARLTCNNNGMQLYDIKESSTSDSKTALLSYANKKWPAKSGNVFYMKGRKDSTCATINNSLGDFTDGFGSCNGLMPFICQFIQASREYQYMK